MRARVANHYPTHPFRTVSLRTSVNRGQRHNTDPKTALYATETSTAARAQNLRGALVPSTRPERSLARTEKYEWELCANIAVSKPLRGTDPNDSSWPVLGPASTSQPSTSVAPFQLA